MATEKTGIYVTTRKVGDLLNIANGRVLHDHELQEEIENTLLEYLTGSFDPSPIES